MERNDYIFYGILIILILLALYAGQIIGYRQGYTYVKNYMDDYIDGNCFCVENTQNVKTFNLEGYNSTYSNLIKKNKK